mmetsp:Transcript_47354/g.108961  ORF Transcript_47354/g.108961 Transcript_47354/m.108961 type:complete len:218 (+) Transcript_47354:1022-1675(+)
MSLFWKWRMSVTKGAMPPTRVEEGARVRDYDERLLPRLQVLLQPQHRVQVQVVGRLIEQQHVRADEERARERHAHAPAAGEGGRRALLVLLAEAEPAQDLGRARGRRVRLDRLQALPYLVEPRRAVLLILSVLLGVLFLQLALLRQQRRALHVGCEHALEHACVAAGHLLLDVQHLQVLRDAVKLFGRQVLEQSRLADPIAPDETVPPPKRDGDRAV